MTIEGNRSPFRDEQLPLSRVLNLGGSGSDETDAKIELSQKRALEGRDEADHDLDFLSRFNKRQRRPHRRVTPSKAKFPKIVPHVVDMDIVGKAVIINGKQYPIIAIAEGKYHKVFEFTGEIPIDLGEDGGSVILKGLNPLQDPATLQKTSKEDIQAYENLLADEVPQPKVYIRPDQFTDTEDPRYGDFWIVEKLDGPAPIEEQYVLDFVKHWITKSVNEEREIIPDFYPRNVMVKGELCYIVDPSLADAEDWKIDIYGFVIAWSNGKQETYDFLTADFPEEVKQIYAAKLADGKQDNNGEFPVTNQTHC